MIDLKFPVLNLVRLNKHDQQTGNETRYEFGQAAMHIVVEFDL